MGISKVGGLDPQWMQSHGAREPPQFNSDVKNKQLMLIRKECNRDLNHMLEYFVARDIEGPLGAGHLDTIHNVLDVFRCGQNEYEVDVIQAVAENLWTVLAWLDRCLSSCSRFCTHAPQVACLPRRTR